jgi:hypothetical protein
LSLWCAGERRVVQGRADRKQGLVHMKMLRRQKREAERAQAKSGQPSGSGK